MSGKTMYDDDDRVEVLEALPDNWRTGPAADDVAGQDASLIVLAPFDLDTTASETIPQRAVGEPTTTQTFGRRNASGTVDYFRFYNEDGQPDPTKDWFHTLVKTWGAEVVFVRRQGGKPADMPIVAGDEISIWQCVVDQIQTPKEEGHRIGRAPLIVKHHTPSVIVAANGG